MKPRSIRVAIFRPLQLPTFEVIIDDLTTMQKLVGGYIEVVRISDDGLILICNEEGKLEGLTFNRVITRPAIPGFESGMRWADRVCGTFFVCRDREDGEMYSVTQADEAELEKWKPSGAWDIFEGKVKETI